MRVLRREEVWIHTHFVTDCTYLPDHYRRDIVAKMDRVLEGLGIVFGIHFDSDPREKGLSIVLECVPLPETMSKIEAALAEIIRAIPSRPRQTKVEIPGRSEPARLGQGGQGEPARQPRVAGAPPRSRARRGEGGRRA